MKFEITKREKALIFISVISLILFFGYRFAIIPMNDHYQRKTEEYEILQLEKEAVQLKLESEALVKQSYDNVLSEFEYMKTIYPSLMPNQDLDKFLTGLCLQSDLNPTSLRINDPIDVEIGEADASSSTVVTVAAYMTVTGTYYSLKKLLDIVNETDYVLISESSYARRAENSLEETATISVIFVVTMIREDEIIKS